MNQEKKPQLELVKPEPLIPEPNVAFVISAQKEFHDKFEVPINGNTQNLYLKLIEEEHEEWIEEYYAINGKEYDELKELSDLLYVTAGLAYQMGYDITFADKYTVRDYYDYAITDIVKEISTGRKSKTLLANLMYCIFGYAQAMGWDIVEAFNRVHQSNLSKLGEDGKPARREDGKVLKGPNYAPPDLTSLTEGR